MKKVLRVFMVLLLLLWALPIVGAFAEAAAGDIDIPMPPTEYMKPEDFATFAGQVVFVVALVQFFKIPADGLFGGHIKTEYVVYVVAFLGQVLARMILPSVAGVLSWSALPTMLLWAFCVAWAAMKSYKVIIAHVEEKKAALNAQKAATPTAPFNIPEADVPGAWSVTFKNDGTSLQEGTGASLPDTTKI